MKRTASWHRDMVRGGEGWDEGRKQLAVLMREGMKPRHRLLDLACGSFRLGVHAIPYLKAGHYTGLDLRWDIIDRGIERELRPRGLMELRPELVTDALFGLRRFEGREFNYVWAYSLFTHLRPWRIRRCLLTVKTYLAPGGRFIASYNRAETLDDENMGTRHPEYDHYQMCLQTEERLRRIAKGVGLSATPLEERCSDAYPAQTHLQQLLVFKHLG